LAVWTAVFANIAIGSRAEIRHTTGVTSLPLGTGFGISLVRKGISHQEWRAPARRPGHSPTGRRCAPGRRNQATSPSPASPASPTIPRIPDHVAVECGNRSLSAETEHFRVFA